VPTDTPFNEAAIAPHRLHQQQLSQHAFTTPAEVVAWLGAVQAQEYAKSKWGLAQRLPTITDAQIEQSMIDGSILRTHVMRPTWHFVAQNDIRWILELTAPRVNALNAYMYRKLELDDALLAQSNEVITNALRDGQQLTREELAEKLIEAGIVADGMRLGYIVHRAELDAVVCSGARRGKQFTYALLDLRAPEAKRLPREEALAELTRRFFTAHGPAMIKEFVWWSGLTTADAKVGLALVGDALVQEKIDGRDYWRSASVGVVPAPPPTAYLLPPYDEYTIAYRHHGGILAPAFVELAQKPLFDSVMVYAGQIIGNWRRTFSKGQVIVELAPYHSLNDEEQAAFAETAERFGAFLEMPVSVIQVDSIPKVYRL
jgi:hypothetical protein